MIKAHLAIAAKKMLPLVALFRNVRVQFRQVVNSYLTSGINLPDGVLALKVSLGSLHPAAFLAVTVNW